MKASLGENVLDWMLRRLHQAVHIERDLVLVHDHPALADVGPSIDVRGDPWRVARVTGELTLRDALPEADRLIALVPPHFPPLPMDIVGRAYLGRILDLRAEDLVSAVSGRFCEALVEESLIKAVFDSLDTLRTTVEEWSLGGLVTARELRAVLVGAELGAAHLDRERDWEILARWLVDGVPKFRAITLVRTALEEAQPRTGALLAWALSEGDLKQLCGAGALLASPQGAELAPKVPGEPGQIIELVESALREVWRRAPDRLEEILADAERSARGAVLDPATHRLLRTPLEGELIRAANLAAEGRPPDDAKIEGLKRNLHALEFAQSIAMVADLARLARFQRLPVPPGEDGALSWFGHALRDVSWADLAYRRVRRALDVTPAWLGDPARRVIAGWLSRRDALNHGFAQALATHWASLARSTDLRQPLSLHQLSRCIIRRLVDDGKRVLLLVLDGCDLASFLEILEAIPPHQRIGLTIPDVRGATLREDLSSVGALGVAISPVPTVTSHSRRALFAGEIPGNTALDDTESAAANASADRGAWERNTALGGLPRRLFLKGDLGATGQPLLDALRQKEAQVIAAVFNGVDDALSSKETTALPRWSFDALGAGAAEVVQTAINEEWCILVTADHGHTPFVSPDRKLPAPVGLGSRFRAEPCEGTIVFQNGPLPRQPLHLLARFGVWFGNQRRGFHGGASLEEVAVPLAFLGKVRGEQEGRPRAPAWWWSTENNDMPLRPSAPRPVESKVEPRAVPRVVPQPTLALPFPLDSRLDPLTQEERLVVVMLHQNQSARLSVVAQHLKKPPMRASGFMQQLIRKLFDLGCACVTVEVLPDNERLYRYQQVDRGDR